MAEQEEKETTANTSGRLQSQKRANKSWRGRGNYSPQMLLSVKEWPLSTTTAVAPCDLGPLDGAVHSPDCANKAEGTDTFTCWGCFI